MINDPRHGIKGLILPDGSELRDEMFADDTNLYLLGTKENMQKAYQVLDRFCQASSAKINWAKCSAIWASDQPQDWSWGEELGLKWIAPGQSTRYLSFPVGYRINQKDKNDKVLQQVRTKLAAWSPRKLSLAARILVTNQVVLASIWYIASCADLDKSILQKARTMVRNFVWGGNPAHNSRA